MKHVTTHKRWTQRIHPFVLSSDIEDYEERKAKSSLNKSKRDKLLQEFIKDETSPGWQLKDIYEEVIKKIQRKEDIDTDHKLYPILSTHYSILPSFFKFYTHLADISAEHDFKFKIIFRTYGSDHQIIFDEFVEFLQGNHPIFQNSHPVEQLFEHEYGN